jgi:hypothetical protein
MSELSENAIKEAMQNFKAPNGMTQVPIMFSGSIQSLQYQDSYQGIGHHIPRLSAAQQFLSKHVSKMSSGQFE